MLIGMTIPLTGTQHEIEAGDYRATVTELGAGLRGLKFGDTFLVTSFEADVLPPHSAGQLLTPWPNRVDGGHYAFDGEEHQLALS
jgi:aldose 1-epimerase